MAASIHLGSGILGHPGGAVMRQYRRGWLRGYVQPHRAPWPAAFASSSAVAVWEFLIIFESFFGVSGPSQSRFRVFHSQ